MRLVAYLGVEIKFDVAPCVGKSQFQERVIKVPFFSLSWAGSCRPTNPGIARRTSSLGRVRHAWPERPGFCDLSFSFHTSQPDFSPQRRVSVRFSACRKNLRAGARATAVARPRGPPELEFLPRGFGPKPLFTVSASPNLYVLKVHK